MVDQTKSSWQRNMLVIKADLRVSTSACIRLPTLVQKGQAFYVHVWDHVVLDGGECRDLLFQWNEWNADERNCAMKREHYCKMYHCHKNVRYL